MPSPIKVLHRRDGMGYCLGKKWSFCVPEDQVVLMDIENNAYVMLPPSLGASFERLRKQEPLDCGDVSYLEALVRAGIIEQQEAEGSITHCSLPVAPERGFDEQDLASWSVRDMALAILALGKTRHALHQCSFAEILAEIRDAKCRADATVAGSEDRRAREIASAFYRMNAYVTRYDQCLLRSLAMIRCLLANRVPADLMFGVATRPFRAHCWVQHRDLVLNDTLEGIRNYTPILVI
ncbi:hypothetical protein J2X73_003689 [Novosphingobium sp. 1748]|uniref:lasso peptide biosynthesis B2 protein n=1 Tax=Novosphingobium sp. 1748 TaxID=2817760 RepID=UPI0028557FBD|nr:lasso peptide biosynthesis B2 protein [Novosphingobium sp. 1748]MDR6709300.1 hypothetical protein [Novosphingobium sp. 1748]